MAYGPLMQGWELGALFLVFLFITVTWELLVGVLTFLNNILRGRKANWLSRVKEELLALGVVSLVLLFVEVRGCGRSPDAAMRNVHVVLPSLPLRSRR